MPRAIGRFAVLLGAAVIAVTLAGPVLADAAPPPYLVELQLTGERSSQPVLEVELHHCADPACQTTTPLSDQPVFGQLERITCLADRCEAWVDPYASDRLVLILHYPDATLRSNPFAFARSLSVDVQRDALRVGPDRSGLLNWFAGALVVTLVLELAVGLIYVVARRRSLGPVTGARVLLAIAIGNVLTLPVVWFLIPGVGLAGPVAYLLGELFAWLAEAALLLLAARPTITPRGALLLSLAMNVVSAGAFLALLAAIALPCSGVHCDPLPLPW